MTDPNERPSQDPGSGKSNGKPGAPMPVQPRRQFMTWMTLLLGAAAVWAILSTSDQPGTKMPQLQDLLTLVRSGDVKPDTLAIRNDRVVAEISPGAKGFPQGGKVWVPIIPSDYNWVRDQLKEVEAKWTEDVGTGVWLQMLSMFLGPLLILGVLWYFISRSVRSAGGGPGGMLGSFGKSRHKLSSKDAAKITFADVAGVEEAKEEVHEIVQFLKDPKRFARLGGRIPRGVLLSGPPGCGKTLLAKAIAGEADVPFFSISGSDFVEMFVGVGASRVRDLFKQAKENSPCIVFLDEIDAVGRRRSGGFTTGGHDEREQTLNAVLVEMDGFEAADQVIVIAATNRADILDPALTRPGRFDRQVIVHPPDVRGRRQILEVHARKIKIGPDADLDRLARATPMLSGADLAAIVNEAAILATMADKDFVEMADFDEARDKVRWGRARRSKAIEEAERAATAYHEAGHALLQMLLPAGDPLHKVTIIPRGNALGITFSLPEKDRLGYSSSYCLATMRSLCGGRLAEERKTNDISSGAQMDIQTVTRIARAMVVQWGMSARLGFVSYSADESREHLMAGVEHSPETARIIDEEVKRLVDEAYADARHMIESNWEKLVAIAEALLKHETLQKDDVERLMRGERLDRPTVSDLLATEMRSPAKPTTPSPANSGPALPGEGSVPSPA